MCDSNEVSGSQLEEPLSHFAVYVKRSTPRFQPIGHFHMVVYLREFQ